MSEKSMRSTRLGGVLQNDIAVREGGIFDLQSWRFYCFFCSKILVFVAFSSLVVRLKFKLPSPHYARRMSNHRLAVAQSSGIA